MLRERNFVGIVGVRFVAVDGLGTVGVLCWGYHFGVGTAGGGATLHGAVTKRGRDGGRPGDARHASDRGRVLKAVQLSRSVHLRRLNRSRSLGPCHATITIDRRPVHGGFLG